MQLHHDASQQPSEELLQRTRALEGAISETERSALQQIGVTPLQTVAMSTDCNPLNDLSAVADYASKAVVHGCREGAVAAPMAAAPIPAAPMTMPHPAYAALPASYGAGVLPPTSAPVMHLPPSPQSQPPLHPMGATFGSSSTQGAGCSSAPMLAGLADCATSSAATMPPCRPASVPQP